MDFITEIIRWYTENKRDLPWRNTKDPYLIWLSEIILQQTRVEQGLPYFQRFAEAYPTVADFAAADEDEILRLWQGLGYYSRGRNMHTTAQMVMEDHGGYFPVKYDELIKLKGIGEYTAAAISSFAAEEPRAVVDGNVFRLLSRYFGIDTPINTGKGKKEFTLLANSLIDQALPGLSNQAMMEFGSQLCRPKNPDCAQCPIALNCTALKLKSIDKLPVKLKTQRIRDRHFNYFLVIKNESILIKKRGPDDIWQHLHDFPLIETERRVSVEELLAHPDFLTAFPKDVEIKPFGRNVKHILSHQRIFAQFFLINYFEEIPPVPNSFYAAFDELEKLAKPKLIFAFLKNFLP